MVIIFESNYKYNYRSAICYMNAILQSLNNTYTFRNAILTLQDDDMKTTNENGETYVIRLYKLYL